ncbi:MAG: AAA family ATPase [Bacilli bacterium]
MKKCDSLFFEHNDFLVQQLESVTAENRLNYSTVILEPFRHFVEHLELKIYCDDNNLDLNDDWANIVASQNYIETHCQYSFLRIFHDMTETSIGHKIVPPDYSTRLMIKYYDNLLEIKDYCYKRYNIVVLENINKYPLDLDDTFLEYYRHIWKSLESIPILNSSNEYDTFYVQKIKPLYFDNHLMYELTLSPANDYTSKFNHFVVFSKINVLNNYAIRAHIINEKVLLFGIDVELKILDYYQVSIRPCEFEKFSLIFNKESNIARKKEYMSLMEYITENKITLDKITQFSKKDFDSFAYKINGKVFSGMITSILEKARLYISKYNKGKNVLLYLLSSMRNNVLKAQLNYPLMPNPRINDLCLSNKTLNFDETPFAAFLSRHKQTFKMVSSCISLNGREHELLARKIKTLSQESGKLYTSFSDLEPLFGKDIPNLAVSYNNSLPSFEVGRKIGVFHDNYYLTENETNSINILNVLMNFTKAGIAGYENRAKQWLSKTDEIIKGDDKKIALQQVFKDSTVYLIYGAAGTGKSTTIRYILKILGNISVLCLASTHAAVENMRRKINDTNAEYLTIKKYLSTFYKNDFGILIIDECSTVSNEAMSAILQKGGFKSLILAGDIYQLSSIDFGNWFNLARNILPNYSKCELTEQFRTQNKELLILWQKVRLLDDKIAECLGHNRFSQPLSKDIFEKKSDDEIILCLNYDGLYGINNINRYLQANNPNSPIEWGQFLYKIDDPVIFDETNRFSDILYNNLKGRICGIEKNEESIRFDVAINRSLTQLNFDNSKVEYIDSLPTGETVVRFYVNKYKQADYDGDSQEIHVVPFQIAYAISIHKSQGLEYQSVKIIITNEIEEKITHNIFYTAVTRSKEKLTIYWTPETENNVLKSLKQMNLDKDGSILKQKYNIGT